MVCVCAGGEGGFSLYDFFSVIGYVGIFFPMCKMCRLCRMFFLSSGLQNFFLDIFAGTILFVCFFVYLFVCVFICFPLPSLQSRRIFGERTLRLSSRNVWRHLGFFRQRKSNMAAQWTIALALPNKTPVLQAIPYPSPITSLIN